MNAKIAVVVPCFRVGEHILEVVAGALQHADRVICVDDCCPEFSGKKVEEHFADPRVSVLYHDTNLGVGGAVKTGYRAALMESFEVIVKLDGDGQMDPDQIPMLANPLLKQRADYSKGNRFFELEFLQGMPWMRLFGNTMLSLFSKVSSGYWRILDPTNGYTAIHASALAALPLDKISNRFFFESDLLFRLNIARAVVMDVPMPARYGTESTNLKIHHVLLPFAFGHVRNFFKRIFYTYFLRDFNIATLELISGLGLGIFGLVFGIQAWSESVASGVPASAGTVMLAGLPALIAVQFLLAFLHYDIQNAPTVPICSFMRRQ